MKVKCFCWYDKIDEVYMRDSFVLDRSTRAVCRGYLASFEQNRKMNPKEFELVRVGDFDDETGEFSPCFPPEVIDPLQVYDRPKPEEGSDSKEIDL